MKSSILAMAIAVTMTGSMPLSSQAADAITSSVKVSPSPTKLSGDEWRALSLSGSRILKHTDQAIAALADKKNDEALTNIDQGLKLVEIINAALPASKVTTEITSGKLSYTDDDLSKPAFIPIFREYDTIDVISPVVEQKQAKGSAANSEAIPDVSYAGLDYTSLKLDLPLAKRELQSAEDLIKKNDTRGAITALQDILATGVIVEFNSIDEPLVRAMDNLRLADSEFVADEPAQAKLALAGASDALKNYEKMTGNSRSKEVKQLEKEIDDTTADIAHETPETFSPKVSGWWSRCVNWLHI